MKKSIFIQTYLPLATLAGEAFELNPTVILAQAAIESGWGESTLAREHNNFFGITAYSKPNAYWPGEGVQLGEDALRFRIYPEARLSFLDYARLIRTCYPQVAALSFHPQAFAKEIAYSRYISEVNGDNREAYRKALCQIARGIENGEWRMEN
jgi:flagellar protein FlgJ